MKNYAERTVNDYMLHVKDFFKYLAIEEYLKTVDDIRSEHIRSFHLQLQTRVCHGRVMSKKSIRTKMRGLKLSFKLLYESGLLKQDLESCILFT